MQRIVLSSYRKQDSGSLVGSDSSPVLTLPENCLLQEMERMPWVLFSLSSFFL